MKPAIIVFPGSNCDRDIAVAIKNVTSITPNMLWHKETSIENTNLIILPGGFSHGDYLRSGSIASRAPIMKEVVKLANNGVPVIGICNGFQILTECALLPGVLMRNKNMKFICKYVNLISKNENRWVSKAEINKVLKLENKGPKAIVANTIKGKGFSFSENNNDWHHKIMTKEMYELGLKELNEQF